MHVRLLRSKAAASYHPINTERYPRETWTCLDVLGRAKVAFDMGFDSAGNLGNMAVHGLSWAGNERLSRNLRTAPGRWQTTVDVVYREYGWL